ncbi:MAG TPA: hypothetical protein PK440_14950 [Candidatus Accumulibacter phosphatis]|nr:hypothetical protein [Candidatus Accumulibacter phosphatis]HRQ96276.1 hypothetical protein [Candidatus Accumulibacter phosphatis]
MKLIDISASSSSHATSIMVLATGGRPSVVRSGRRSARVSARDDDEPPFSGRLAYLDQSGT